MRSSRHWTVFRPGEGEYWRTDHSIMRRGLSGRVRCLERKRSSWEKSILADWLHYMNHGPEVARILYGGAL